MKIRVKGEPEPKPVDDLDDAEYRALADDGYVAGIDAEVDRILSLHEADGSFEPSQVDGGPRPAIRSSFHLGDSDLASPDYESLASRSGRHPSRLAEAQSLALAAGLTRTQVDDPEFKTRLFTFTGSDESVDRYGCRVLVDGVFRGDRYGRGWLLRDYKRAPRFMAWHSYNAIPAGRSLETWIDKGDGSKDARKRLRFLILMDEGPAKGGASEIAPLFTRAYNSRLMDSVSVGWWPVEVYSPKDEDERKALGLDRYGVLFVTNDLWELSGVSIPGNANARLERGAESALALTDDDIRRYTEFASLIEKDGGVQGQQFAAQVRGLLHPAPIGQGRGADVPPDVPEEAPEPVLETSLAPTPEQEVKKPTCPDCGGSNMTCSDCGYSHSAAAPHVHTPPTTTLSATDLDAVLAAVNSAIGRVPPPEESRGCDPDLSEAEARLQPLVQQLEASVARLDTLLGRTPSPSPSRESRDIYSEVLRVTNEVLAKFPN